MNSKEKIDNIVGQVVEGISDPNVHKKVAYMKINEHIIAKIYNEVKNGKINAKNLSVLVDLEKLNINIMDGVTK